MPSLTPAAPGTVVNFLFWRGVPPPTRTRVATWQVPGINGVGAITLGKGDSEGTGRAEYFAASDAYAQTFWKGLMACQGALCTLIDDFGDAYANIIPTHIGQPVKKGVISGGYSGVYVTVDIKFVTVV